ncbi:hypothetical protein K461DRAFT_251900 [Myriangium duriaei CBS 260.36]|uniref:PCI domain-containing protein n=1 Tax=Myriangium duriaei CBS 260.36 TaxID=1168546 RepID=A0A9P4MQR7_9PEZI|nr:hypothetical protein K461DRAFT_251900 [Myriangium duriaei CBS 260.36]
MAAPLEQSPHFAARLQRGELVVRDPPKFDLESYIGNYDGRVRLMRLQHIANLSPPLCLEALHLAIPESKQARDPEMYISLTSLLHEIDTNDALAAPDVEWVERRNKENKRETERLEQELKGYKNNLIKESIRMGQEDIASHYLATSDFENAQKSFQRMREYCTTPKHIAEMTVKLIYTCIISGQWIMAQSHCHKARVLNFKPEEKAKFDPVIEACSGLAYLGVEDYQNAAKTFLRVNPSYLTGDPVTNIDFPKRVVSGNDIAVYGGLTALASMDRRQLRDQVLENADFRVFLELEPHIRRAISAFCDAKYSACLEALEAYRSDYLLDIYLGARLNDIYYKIRTKSIIQFFVPFSHVCIADLAAAFPWSGYSQLSSAEIVTTMESELASMISAGTLEARIDAVDGVLLAPPRDLRRETQQDVLDTAAEIERALRLKLHRLNMSHAGLELNNPKLQRGKVGGHTGWDAPDLGTPMSNV